MIKLQKNCNKIAKKFEKKLKKKIAKKLKKSCKKVAKNLQNVKKKIFLLCKIFAKFLQILNLHTDFRPREESISFLGNSSSHIEKKIIFKNFPR